eukprot:gene10236-2656_t
MFQPIQLVPKFYPALQYGKVSCNTTHFSLKSFFNKDCSNPSETIIQDQCIFANTLGESYHCDGSIVNFRGFRNNICAVISSSTNVTSGQCLGFGSAGIKTTCGNSIPNSASSWSIFPMLLVFMFLIHFLE